ncbi:hypothetical protein EMIHUDRAFT_444072 [Emiliania huxleyi CCMP1516]|uniref:Uncharacterized protein n=2 Tax=Emiliania huxleyi TaxID=2903 RepID=A0A0D3JJ27_EMIH1|nr:hypothetical protein EMIHUDRAFT_444072 [Emiliania huxleyi CCMP1516]EOD23512.1 hypothetical protein EMIHUDRAFT_444072 [Emiliania huxleyi CCMP1516]|eukprot:XP_005775941.1 hypothetical protein EMIHUDRAFT_444072 [Emiliania huxleyi CCMP1516]
MRASAAPQKAAHEALVKAHAADEKRRVAETAALAASDPSKLVGSEVSVRRKVQRGSSTSTTWQDGRIIAFAADQGCHTVQYSKDAAAEELNLVQLPCGAAGGGAAGGGSGALAWRPKGAAPPKGRFQWDAASEEALLALGCAQLSLQEKEGEWSKLPSQLLRKPILHGTWRRPATPEDGKDDKDDGKEGKEDGTGVEAPAFKAMIEKVRKMLPHGWVTNKIVATTFERVRAAPPPSPSPAAAAPAAAAGDAPGPPSPMSPVPL